MQARRPKIPFEPLTRDNYVASPLPINRELESLFPQHEAQVVFDVGSCEGEDAIRYATFFPAAVVYAVEALPANIPLIESNLARHPGHNIRIIPVALSDTAGRMPFFVSSGQPQGMATADWDYGNKSSSLLRPDRHLETHPWLRFDTRIEVEVETLETVCEREGIDQIDFLHLDVQGAELAVLRGAGTMIDSIGVVWMEVEAIPLYQEQPLKDDVERFMTGHGFRCLVDTVGKVSGDQLYFNPRIVSLSRRPLEGLATKLRSAVGRLASQLAVPGGTRDGQW